MWAVAIVLRLLSYFTHCPDYAWIVRNIVDAFHKILLAMPKSVTSHLSVMVLVSAHDVQNGDSIFNFCALKGFRF